MSEQMKHRMQQWETTPPPGCWHTIDSRLNEAAQPAPYAAKLYDTAVTPPLSTWNTIAAALNETAKTAAPVRKLFRSGRVAAVVILVVLAFGGKWAANYFLNNRLAIPSAPAANNNSRQPATAAVQNNTPDNDDNNTDDPGDKLNGYRNPVRRPVASNTRLLKYTAVNIQPAYHEYPITVAHSPQPGDAEAARNNMNPLLVDNNYLVITSPNGQATRASLKIADALRYLYGDNGAEEAADKTNNENSHWKKRLQEWRSKIISSHFIPATNNFLDIIDLKDLIDEKP